MSTHQCIHYALSAGVVAAALGCRSAEEYALSLSYLDASDEERTSRSYRESLRWSQEPTASTATTACPAPGISISLPACAPSTRGRAACGMHGVRRL